MTDEYRPQFSGNMPPAMRAAMEQQKKEADHEMDEGRVEGANTPREHLEPMAAPVRPKSKGNDNPSYMGNEALESVLGRLEAINYRNVELPSKGKFYKTGPAKSGFLNIRPMTGAEEEVLTTAQYAKKNEIIDKLFARCIREKVNTEDLLSIDRTFLLIWLRGISYSTMYEIEVTCPDTDHKFPATVDLDNDVQVEHCPSDFDENSLEGTLPKSGFHFKYRLPTGKDDRKVSEHRERRIKMLGSNVVDDTLTYRTALLTREIEGLTSDTDIITLLKKLPIDDVSYIRNMINNPPFGVDTQITLVSPYSANEFTIDLPLDASFFFPRFRRRGAEK